MNWQDKEWIENRAALFMPVMDHEIVANLNPFESGWIVDRAFTFGICRGNDTLSLMGSAHVYPARGPGLNTHVMRLDDGLYWVQRYSLDGTGYYPFYVRPAQVVGAIPVNIEIEVGSTTCQSSR